MRRIFTHQRRRAARRRQIIRDLVLGVLFVAAAQFAFPMIPGFKSITELPASVALALVTPEHPEGSR